jgi:dihydroxy-acid dehydratase
MRGRKGARDAEMRTPTRRGRMGLENCRLLITDGGFPSFGGASIGTFAEARRGRSIALVREGDTRQDRDITNNFLQLEVAERRMNQPRSGWQPLPPKYTRGYLARYISMSLRQQRAFKDRRLQY